MSVPVPPRTRGGLRVTSKSDAYAEPLIEATAKYQIWFEALDQDQRSDLLVWRV